MADCDAIGDTIGKTQSRITVDNKNFLHEVFVMLENLNERLKLEIHKSDLDVARPPSRQPDQVEDLRLKLFQKDCELKEVKEKLVDVQKGVELQNDVIRKLRRELKSIQKELDEHSSYCTTLGSVFSTIIWKLTKSNECVSVFSPSSMIEKFFHILEGTLFAFVQTYKDDMPKANSEEYKYILAITGIICNVCITTEGCEYLLSAEMGRALFTQLVNTLSEVDSVDMSHLKEIMLLAIYNAVLTEVGTKELSKNQNLVPNVIMALYPPHNYEMINLAVRILLCLIEGAPKSYVEYLWNTVPVDRIEKLTQSKYGKTKQMAIQFLNRLQEMHQRNEMSESKSYRRTFYARQQMRNEESDDANVCTSSSDVDNSNTKKFMMGRSNSRPTTPKWLPRKNSVQCSR